MSVKISGLRTKARVFAPEAFDAGQVVEFGGQRGVVWSLGPDVGRNRDSRWIACEDGAVRVLQMDKVDGEFRPNAWASNSWDSYWPSNATPFSVSEFASEFVQSEMELAA